MYYLNVIQCNHEKSLIQKMTYYLYSNTVNQDVVNSVGNYTFQTDIGNSQLVRVTFLIT